MKPQNNASSNENSKNQNKQSKLSSKSLPPAPKQQTSNTLQQITEIMRDVMKPETIKEILESLKIITTTINQIITATTSKEI